VQEEGDQGFTGAGREGVHYVLQEKYGGWGGVRESGGWITVSGLLSSVNASEIDLPYNSIGGRRSDWGSLSCRGEGAVGGERRGRPNSDTAEIEQ